MKHILKEWKWTLHQMRLKHPELLLFKIHKVFQMFIALQSENVETLIKEMLLLFTDVHKTGLELVITIQVSIGLHTCIFTSGMLYYWNFCLLTYDLNQYNG